MNLPSPQRSQFVRAPFLRARPVLAQRGNAYPVLADQCNSVSRGAWLRPRPLRFELREAAVREKRVQQWMRMPENAAGVSQSSVGGLPTV